MDSLDVERIKQIVQAELAPALKQIEDRLMTTLASSISGFETKIGVDHAENRTRMQFIDQGVAKTAAQNEFIIRNQQEMKEESQEQRGMLQDLLRAIGKREGEDAADLKHNERRKSILKAGFAVVGSGGLLAGWHWLAGLMKKW